MVCGHLDRLHFTHKALRCREFLRIGWSQSQLLMSCEAAKTKQAELMSLLKKEQARLSSRSVDNVALRAKLVCLRLKGRRRKND